MLWGRGAVDMKDMDAMILTSVADILRSGEQPERDLVLAFFADEENGGVEGSALVVQNKPEWFAGATEAISEVGGYSIAVGDRRAYLLQVGEKALIWIRLVARGRAAHGSSFHGDNAVTKLAAAVAALGRTEWPVQPHRHARARWSRGSASITGAGARRPRCPRRGDGRGIRIPPLDAADDDQPHRPHRRLQAQRDPRPRRGAHRRADAARHRGRRPRRHPPHRRRRGRGRDRPPGHRPRGAVRGRPRRRDGRRRSAGTTPASR